MNETKIAMSRKLKLTFVVSAIVLVASLYGNLTLWNKVKTLQNPQAAAESQVRQIIAQVGKLIVLPQNETPTIATVSDLAPLKSQPFFVNAAIGDQVLIYAQARKVVLWRPAENKIIEVAPLNINIPESSAALPKVGEKAAAGK